jgi:hypothetical protein
MTATLHAPVPQPAAAEHATAPPDPPLRLERRHWLAALAVLVVFFATYQTLVQTVLIFVLIGRPSRSTFPSSA